MSSSRFNVYDTQIKGLKVVQRKPIVDERGFLARLYCVDEFKCFGFADSVAQINHTFTRSLGSVRGLHFQYPPHAETKLVTCLHGKIFDVAVDIRRQSSTFLKWHGEILSAENQKSLLIPEGFAHGFQTLMDDSELIYLHSRPYNAESEGALHYADPRIGIIWPKKVTNLSGRDREHPFIDDTFLGVENEVPSLQS